jgi:hypothetical protein
MAQGGGGARFTPEAFDETCIGHKLLQEHLDRHLVADVHTARAIDRAHAAFAEARAQFVLAVERLADERVAFRQRRAHVRVFGRRVEGGERDAAV